MTHKPVMVGCDPEVFLTHTATGNPISAFGMFPGTKAEPHAVMLGAIQVDGTALEFNTDPTNDRDTFINNVNVVYEQMAALVPAGLHIDIKPVATYGAKYLREQPLEAKTLGCDPDFSGWTGAKNPRPNSRAPIRTASGHIHVGFKDNPSFDECCEMAKQLDYYVGIQSLLWDGDNTRRSMYGKAGAFRPKPYGMEYRTPSNAWLKSDYLKGWIFDAVQRAVEDYNDGIRMYEPSSKRTGGFGPLAQMIINENMTDWVSRYPALLNHVFVPELEAA